MTDPYRAQKNAFARYPTGVTVVSCAPPGRAPLAITVNSFTSVSLEPTLVLWCLDKKSSVFAAYDAADNYAVSILAADQAEASNRFATPGRHDLLEGEGETYATGAPLLRGRIAGFDCEVADRHDAGDHVVLIGRVVHFDSRDGHPLIYAGRQYLEGPIVTERDR
ncbi:flavin reductase family protein [Parvularcula dongshanensis]|uniref:Flavin reductase (DIM6/NTAB) family NADH-FMN oxidoreductase RutF n=1 Tax=Parvularcula dongshanensis TaxID=1173995 RepID=A0A840HZX3_9PROT|nr:flavin reductase family protein [Parvularcula dongshanensis]MBB4657573.1 flavin reductase (DIM6/NTAB) family NADH-FMN oxidoreductase RutF [Parvularcula dongshanensis]